MNASIASILLVLLPLTAAAQRLPRSVIPEHYDLTFAPDFATETFAGDETIHVSVQQPVTDVVLHAVEIEFREVTIESNGKVQRAAVAPEPQSEWVRLSVAEPLSIGPATIRIRYSGVLNRELRGLYLGEANGRKYASTQMEATDARAAFPSFDEPEMKATFAITAIVDRGDAAISNGAERSDTPGPGDGKQTIRFATTPRMSPYLVALTAGDFRCLKDEIDGVPLRICGTPDKVRLGTFALDATKVILKYFNEYYGIRYPFGKLDQTGVADFRYGAMENTGAILYRDSILFVDADNAAASDKRGAASTIAHEIAHMWFGDLVTMRWWDDIWLNEGFATWITNKPLNAWKPEWKMDLREAGSTWALHADALHTSRPIRQQANTPAEIDELFDGIAYEKTASVLAMLESYIGEENFRKGVNEYLASRAYDNATFFDFADSLRAASKAPVIDILKTFVEQPGVPLIRASAECRDNESWIAIEQERFFLDPSPAPSKSQRWMIPVCFNAGGARRCELMTEARTIRVPGCDAMHLNADAKGYYLVQHSLPMVDALLSAGSRFDPAERMALVRDEWLLIRSARRPVGDFLRLAIAFQQDDEPLIRDAVVTQLPYIRDYITSDADRPRFEAWARRYLQPMVREIGWSAAKSDSEDMRALRASVINTLGEAGNDPSVFREARRRVERSLSGRQPLDPEMAETLVHLAAAGGDARLYDRYLAALRGANAPDAYYRYFYALASFRDPALIRRTLEFALSDEVKNQDTGRLIAGVIANRFGREIGWRFLETDWARLEKKLPERMRGGVLAAGRFFCDAESLQRVKAVYEKHPVESAARTMAQTLERVGICIALREKQAPNLHDWLMSAEAASTSRPGETDTPRR